MASPGQRKANLRLAWILASTALVFALGFVAKIALFSH
ncbi:MAG TPA: cytochrome oxidase small assembly protein [Burkholderiaceae bacterium]|nr:cytochrome oxidase small assembly protein [Burkholderiaceae bacterium]